MSRFLLFPQFLGIIPFRITVSQFVESSFAARLNLVLSIVFTVCCSATVIADFILPRNLCSDPLYIFTDKFVLYGSVPFIMNYLWRNRNQLLQLMSSNQDIFIQNRFTQKSRYILFLRILSQIFLNVFITIINIDEFATCPVYSQTGYLLALWYWWAFDMLFYIIYEQTADVLRCQMLAVKNHFENPEKFYEIKEAFITALLNIKEANSLLGPYALLTASCLLGQVLSLFDFVLRDLQNSESLTFLCGMGVNYAARIVHICWITALPATYVS